MRGSLPHIAVVLVAAGLIGCSTSVDPQRNNDMKSLGLAYHTYLNEANKAPSKPEDLAKYVHDPRVIELLKSGEVVFIWNVRIEEMPMGDETVLAYEKKVPDKGGLALYSDSSVRQITAEKFKKATLAKPKGQ